MSKRSETESVSVTKMEVSNIHEVRDVTYQRTGKMPTKSQVLYKALEPGWGLNVARLIKFFTGQKYEPEETKANGSVED